MNEKFQNIKRISSYIYIPDSSMRGAYQSKPHITEEIDLNEKRYAIKCP